MSDEAQNVNKHIDSTLDAFNRGDLEAYQGHFAQDFTVIPANGPMLKGIDDYMKNLRERVDKGLSRGEHTNLETKVHGNVGVCYTGLTLYGRSNEIVRRSRILLVLVKDEVMDNWKISYEMWTQD